jgi:peptidyl-prolyl cis-trans isomerase D
MLQFIRSKAGSFIVKILFVLLIACFGLWGVGDFFHQLPNDNTVITVGKAKIKPPEIQQAVDDAIERMKPYFGGSLDRSQAKQLGLVDRAVNQLIDQSLFDQEIGRLDLRVGDDQLLDIVANDPTFRGKDGKFDRTVFDGLLAEHRLTETQYMSLLHQKLPREDLSLVVGGNPRAPLTLAALLYTRRAEKRVVDYVFLDGSKLPPPAAPDDKTLRQFYQQNLPRFTAPEYRRLTLVALTNDDVMNQVSVSEDKLQDYYQQNIEEFSKEETRDISQILLPDLATAKTAEAALAAGTPFAVVAKTIAHQDPNTIALGNLARRSLPPDLGAAAFALRSGASTAPVKTDFGWNILHVNAISPAHTLTFAEARPQIVREASANAASDALYQLSNKVQDALAAGADLGAIAQQFNLKQLPVPAIDANGDNALGLPVLGLPIDAAGVAKVAFATTLGQVSALTQTEDGKFFLVRVDGVTPATPKPFERVEDAVAAAWTADRRDHALEDAATALMHAVTPSRTLAGIAAERHLSLGTTQPFAREDTAAASPLPVELISRTFDLKPGEAAAAPGRNVGVAGHFVVQLKAIQTPNPVDNPQDVAALGREIDKQLSDEMMQAFDNSLRTRFPVTINQPTLDSLF